MIRQEGEFLLNEYRLNKDREVNDMRTELENASREMQEKIKVGCNGSQLSTQFESLESGGHMRIGGGE